MVDRRDGPALAPQPGDDVLAAVHAMSVRLYAIEDDFVAAFRNALAPIVPELNHVPDAAGLAEGLARAVLWAGLTTDPPSVIEETFRNVGGDYCRRGFPSGAFHDAGHALLRAARETGTATGDWSSEVSSAWVAFYAWLATHLAEGARMNRSAGAGVPGPAGLVAGSPVPPMNPPMTPPMNPVTGQPVGQPMERSVGQGGSGPANLDEVVDVLRMRYFTGNERALGAIISRVALRTGADLWAPRPDQRDNPAVLANVTAVLEVMGYPLTGAPPTAAEPDEADPGTRSRWWSRRRPDRG